MGNCLFLEEKPIRIMKTDGKILEYKAPTRVFQVLSDFSGHAISDSVPISHLLQQNAKLLHGHLYFLIPIPAGSQSPEVGKKPKKVQFSIPPADEKETDNDEDEDEEKGQSANSESSDGRVVRIKLVMTKKELQQMIENGGISAEEMVCRFKSEESCRKLDDDDLGGDNGGDQLQRWKPALESIPESEVDC